MPIARFLAALLLVAACAPAAEPTPAPDLAAERVAVEGVLTEFHQLASEGAWDRYFDLFTPDAVFFGTDATERWSVDEFKGYAAGSTGWTYLMTERNVFVATDGRTAWFDERLQNARYGETRGTGVLVKDEAGWKITQYNLTIPIPNDLAVDVADRIKALGAGE